MPRERLGRKVFESLGYSHEEKECVNVLLTIGGLILPAILPRDNVEPFCSLKTESLHVVITTPETKGIAQETLPCAAAYDLACL